jgi:photosystem I P700 chlorophyll a apoprotein A2
MVLDLCNSSTKAKSATKRYFQILGKIHDLEAYFPKVKAFSLNLELFLCHWGHLGLIFLWASGNLFHIAWSGNYELWLLNPIGTLGVGHGLWDPHFASGSESGSLVLFSGIFHWLYSVGFRNLFQIYNFQLLLEFLALGCLVLGKLHLLSQDALWVWLRLNLGLGAPRIHFTQDLKHHLPFRSFLASFDISGLRWNLHLSRLFGFLSIAWSGHWVHAALRLSRGLGLSAPGLSFFPSSSWLGQFSLEKDGRNHLFGSGLGAGKGILSFLGGVKSESASLYLPDIAHHHLALGVLLLWAGQLGSSFSRASGHRRRDVISGAYANGTILRALGKSLELELSLGLAGLSLLTSLLAQEVYSLTAYAYLSYDSITTLALYLHHTWIASLLMMAAFLHASIFLVRDFTSWPWALVYDPISRILSQKAAILSGLSWVSLWLGFHSFGLYLHNDTVVAFAEPEKEILLEPLLVTLVLAFGL